MSRPIKILFVDDDPDDHVFLQAALNEIKQPIHMISIKDGGEGMDYLLNEVKSKGASHSEPDVIISDLNMPKVNGYNFLKKIKTDQELKHIPVYILTTSTDPKVNQICKDIGAENSYIKPNKLSEMKLIVQDILKHAGITG